MALIYAFFEFCWGGGGSVDVEMGMDGLVTDDFMLDKEVGGMCYLIWIWSNKIGQIEILSGNSLLNNSLNNDNRILVGKTALN